MKYSDFRVYDAQIKSIVESDGYTRKIDIIKRINFSFSYQDRKTFSKYLERNLKRITDNHEGIYKATNSLDIDNSNVKHLWVKNKEASLFVKNPNYVEIETEKINDLRETLIKDLQQYSPKFPKLERIKDTNG